MGGGEKKERFFKSISRVWEMVCRKNQHLQTREEEATSKDINDTIYVGQRTDFSEPKNKDRQEGEDPGDDADAIRTRTFVIAKEKFPQIQGAQSQIQEQLKRGLSSYQSKSCLAETQLIYRVHVLPSKEGELIPSSHLVSWSYLLPPLRAAHTRGSS